MDFSFFLLCLGTLALGYILCLVIYRIKGEKLRKSPIETKIFMWVPIFLLVVLYSLQFPYISWMISAAIVYFIVREYGKYTPSFVSLVFLVVVTSGIIMLTYISIKNTQLFLFIWYCSVLSDVTAYFSGTLIGRHKLPRSINSNKAWEGVFGQIIGTGIAYLLLIRTGIHFNEPSWLVIGWGATLGDLYNSYIKRTLNIKNWSEAIPGHGGYLDRLCSLSFATLSLLLFATIF